LTTPNTDGIDRLLHDLREPIGAFIIYLSLLENEELSADGRRHVEAMVRNARRLAKMIGDITEALGFEGNGSTSNAILSEKRGT
jgi:signal transduction histidine kinase